MSNNRETAELRKIQSEIKRLAEQQERTAAYLKAIAQMKKEDMDDPISAGKIEIDE